MADFAPLDSSKLITRKIWVIENFRNFHSVMFHKKSVYIWFTVTFSQFFLGNHEPNVSSQDWIFWVCPKIISNIPGIEWWYCLMLDGLEVNVDSVNANMLTKIWETLDWNPNPNLNPLNPIFEPQNQIWNPKPIFVNSGCSKIRIHHYTDNE